MLAELQRRLLSLPNLRLIILILQHILLERLRHLWLDFDKMCEEEQKIGQKEKDEGHCSRANKHEGIDLVSGLLLIRNQSLWHHRGNMNISTVRDNRSNLP